MTEVEAGLSLVPASVYVFFFPSPSSTLLLIAWALALCCCYPIASYLVGWLGRRMVGQDCSVAEQRRPNRPAWLEIMVWLAAAAVLDWLIVRTGIPGTPTEHALVLVFSLGSVFYARVVAQPFFYAVGLYIAAASIAAAFKAPHYAFFLIGCAAGVFCMTWALVRLAGLKPHAGSSPPPIFHPQ